MTFLATTAYTSRTAIGIVVAYVVIAFVMTFIASLNRRAAVAMVVLAMVIAVTNFMVTYRHVVLDPLFMEAIGDEPGTLLIQMIPVLGLIPLNLMICHALGAVVTRALRTEQK